MGLDSQYIGDGYPLCSDLPDQHFLKKGATYLLLGSDPNPSLHKDPSSWRRAAAKRLSLDFENSGLARELCNSDGNECKPKGKVTLPNDIACTGIECEIDAPRSLQVAEGLWFEYVRPACVNTAFYDNPQSMRQPWSDGFEYYMCGNPLLPEGGSTCCTIDPWWYSPKRDLKFGGERVKLAEAVNRCPADENKKMCADPWMDDNDCKNVTKGGCDVNQFHWSSEPCTLQAKITDIGDVIIVHKHHVPGKPKTEENKPHVWFTHRMVDEKSIMNFRVDWKSGLEKLLKGHYSRNCKRANCWINEFDGLCQCNVTVYEDVAFPDPSAIVSADDVLSVATFGVFEMVYSPLSFVSTGIENVEIDSASDAAMLTKDTIFRVTDSNGIVRYRKNVASNAQLGDGDWGPILRTPVSFMVSN